MKVYESVENDLLDADQIVFCGYSFPDADMHIQYLLKRIELNRLKRTPLVIKIVNWHEEKSDDIIMAEEERYTRFFSRRTDVRYLKDEACFQKFANNPADFL